MRILTEPALPGTAPRPPKKRRLGVAVVSDVHLGTYGCHAPELLRYLKSIRPQVLVLNGDIVDIWQFSKNYWPPSHMRVVRYLAGLAAKGTKIYYLTGNDLPHGRTWLFHGDVFDVTMQHSRWLARLGGKGYDLLILLNRLVNFGLHKLGRSKVALSKAVKDRVKSAVSLISDFEQTAATIAADQGYRYVACGHIHQPEIKTLATPQGAITYLNSGDWVENLTALEYTTEAGWALYRYADDPRMLPQPGEASDTPEADELAADAAPAALLESLLAEFKLK
jgi:UDP-2,3-diacylglucosamine pyrophosphatase LpxH